MQRTASRTGTVSTLHSLDDIPQKPRRLQRNRYTGDSGNVTQLRPNMQALFTPLYRYAVINLHFYQIHIQLKIPSSLFHISIQNQSAHK